MLPTFQLEKYIWRFSVSKFRPEIVPLKLTTFNQVLITILGSKMRLGSIK